MVHYDDLPPGRPDPVTPVDGVSGADMRAAPRFTLLIRVAKLTLDDVEVLCILRDASATGAKVRLFAPLPPHHRLVLELANGERFPAKVVWQAGDNAGLQFDEPVAVERLIDEVGTGSGRRQVRLRVNLEGVLHSGGEAVPVRFHDLSQQGAHISGEKWLLVNELVRVETPGGPQGGRAIYAKVRWRNHPNYGLVFEQTFRLEELARFVAALQDPGGRDAKPAPMGKAG